jgi:uncharacterized protein YbbC (DUF1343 family)
VLWKRFTKFPEIKGKLDLSFVIDAYQNFDKKTQDFFLKNLWFDTLAGTDELRKQIISGTPETEIRKSWQKRFRKFRENPSQICSLRKLINCKWIFSLITVFIRYSF